MRPRALSATSLAATALAITGLARAESGLPPLEPPASTRSGAESTAERKTREERLRALEQRSRESVETRVRLEREIADLRADRARLSGAVVAAGDRTRAAEDRVRAAEMRLDALLVSDGALRLSLAGRQEVIAEVLAALQRLGRGQPPALLVRVDDLLAALRSATMLGAVIPGLREEARRLASELADLARLRFAIVADRQVLDAEFASLATERDRLSALIQVRQERLSAAEYDAGRERFRHERLGQEVRTLRGLIEWTEAEASRVREAEARAEQDARQTRERFAAAAAREPLRLAPRQPFADIKGSLIKPASGHTLRDFGAPDGSGGSLKGSVISTRSRAVVTSPADGAIVFAGPFRSFGRLLIINAGGGYYLVLAGMDLTSVEVGQFVLAGEPVGQMGEVAAPSAALGVVEAVGPVLYVELRKDGGSLDLGPWWAKSQGERARG